MTITRISPSLPHVDFDNGAGLIEIELPPDGPTGIPGISTGPQWLWDTGTSDADPGAGTVRANNASLASATFLYIDTSDRFGNDVSGWLAALDDSGIVANRGRIRLAQRNDESVFAEFRITDSIISGSGYRKIPVVYVAPASAPTFADTAPLVLTAIERGADGTSNVSINYYSVLTLIADTVPGDYEVAVTYGYYASGDSEPMTWKRFGSAPSGGVYIQSADGDYWLYQPDANGYNARCIGLRATGVSNQKATSTSSVAVGSSGSKSLTVQTGKDFQPGDYICIARNDMPTLTAQPAHDPETITKLSTYVTVESLNADLNYDDGDILYVFGGPVAEHGAYTKSGASGTGSWSLTWLPAWIRGTVTSYNSGTGALVIDADSSQGSGTFSAWDVELDDTARWQALLAAYPSGDINIYCTGRTVCGTLSYPSFNPYTIRINGKIYCPPTTEGFDVSGRVLVEGFGGGSDIQFGPIRSMGVAPHDNTVVCMRIWTAAEKVFRNIIIDPPNYIGWFQDGSVALSARNHFINCACAAKASAPHSVPYWNESTFWVDHKGQCAFQAASGSAPFSMVHTNSIGADSDGGATSIIVWEDGTLVRAGILIDAERAGAAPGDWSIEQMWTESFPSGNDGIKFQIRNASTHFTGLVAKKFELADSDLTNCFMFNRAGSSTGSVRNIKVDDHVSLYSKYIRPTSFEITNAEDVGLNQDYTGNVLSTPYSADHPHDRWMRIFRGVGIEGRILNQPRIPTIIPVTPLAVKQNPADFAGGVLSGGATASATTDPFGQQWAVKIEGTNGGFANAYVVNNSVAEGDWFIVACAVRSTEAGKLVVWPQFTVNAAPAYVLDGISATINIGQYNPKSYVDDLKWNHLCQAVRVTTGGGGGTGSVILRYNRDTSKAITAYAYGIIYHFPVADGWQASEIFHFSQTLGMALSTAKAGDFCLPYATRLLLAPGTTARASMNLPSGAAPTSPINGDIWSDGTNAYIRLGGVTRTFTVT